jgi:hypothetical protein
MTAPQLLQVYSSWVSVSQGVDALLLALSCSWLKIDWQ